MDADGERCQRPSTHMRGGGYTEVECYCEEHSLLAAVKYGDKTLPSTMAPDHGALDTTLGMLRNRRRCQWREENGGACCERDTDKDGECPWHPRNPGQFFNKGGT